MKSMLTVLTASCGLVFFVNCGQPQQASDATIAESKNTEWNGFASEAAYGEHIALVSGCNDCHTPKIMGPMGPEDDTSLVLAGYMASMPLPPVDRKMLQSMGLGATHSKNVWAGPWGVSYAANLTPHESGIGTWSFDQFKLALREGKWKGLANSRPLLPPMPWKSYRHMRDEELHALFTYLKSLKPVDNVVPNAEPPVQ